MNTPTKLILSSIISSFLLAGCGGSDTDNSPPPIYDQCSLNNELNGFYDYMQDAYLWNDLMPTNVNPQNYSSVYALLDALVIPEDRYSFILTEQEYQSRFVAAEYVGFGFASRITTDNRVFINYVYADSPADIAGMTRSDELTHIGGESVQVLLAQNRYEEALGAAQAGVSVELTWRDMAGNNHTDILTKTTVETNTVLAATRLNMGEKEVGYFVLNSFINRTGADLNSAYNQFDGVDELIIDVRYNGGGLTRYANQTASQAAGNNVIGKVFAKYLFNSNNASANFIENFQLYDGIRQLNLDRVYVLTTAASCSSSELIINSLDPHVEVIVIGQPTCGKPVGQIPERLCDKRTFVVNFETVNALNEGRYFNGLAPNCYADDVLVGDWGDVNDPMLITAAYHMQQGNCPVAVEVYQDVAADATQAPAVIAPAPAMKLPDLWRQEH